MSNLTTTLAIPLILLPALFLVSCAKKPIKYDWLQGEWISGVEETMEAHRERGKPASPSAGKLVWSVQGNRLYITDYSIDLEEDARFEIEAVNDVELRLKAPGINNFIVKKTDYGFCSEAYAIASALITLHCFVPYHS